MSDTGTHDTAQPPHTDPGLDEQALGRWLQAQVPGFAGGLQIQRFQGGQSNPSYLLSSPAMRLVLRTKPGPAARLLPSAHAIEREFAVMQGLHASAVPVPRMYGLCEDESVIGRAFYVMEYVEGRIFWEQSLPGLDPAQRTAIYDETNRVLAALHSVRPETVGLSRFGKPGNYFERQIGRWSKQYQASVTQPIEAMERLIDWLPQRIPASANDPRCNGIVHGDYRLDNLIFHPHEARILAVLDWELSTLGHPLADFSYHCMSWHIPPGTFRGIGGLDLAQLGIPSEAAYIQRYCERTGFCTAQELAGDWNFYLAYNLFRMAAILQGIAKRIEAGTASSAQAQQSAAGARPLAELAWRFAQQA